MPTVKCSALTWSKRARALSTTACACGSDGGPALCAALGVALPIKALLVALSAVPVATIAVAFPASGVGVAGIGVGGLVVAVAGAAVGGAVATADASAGAGAFAVGVAFLPPHAASRSAAASAMMMPNVGTMFRRG